MLYCHEAAVARPSRFPLNIGSLLIETDCLVPAGGAGRRDGLYPWNVVSLSVYILELDRYSHCLTPASLIFRNLVTPCLFWSTYNNTTLLPGGDCLQCLQPRCFFVWLKLSLIHFTTLVRWTEVKSKYVSLHIHILTLAIWNAPDGGCRCAW